MNITPENKKKLTKWLIGVAAACILIFLGVENIDAVAAAFSWVAGIAMPLIVGCAIAVILNVPMRFFEEHLWKKSKNPFLCKARKVIAFLISLVLIVGILVGIVVIVLPTLIETVKLLIQSAVAMVNRLNAMSEGEISQLPFGEFLVNINWNNLLNSLKDWLGKQSNDIVNTIFGTITSFVVAAIDMFVAIAFAIYLLFSKETLKAHSKRLVKIWLPEKKANWICHAFSVANVNFKSFIAGQFLEAVILAALCFVGMVIFKFPYPAMISVLVGVTALIPVIGGFIGGGVGAFIILSISPSKALWFVLYLVVLQQLEGNAIYPKVMGNRMRLSAVWILAAVTIGGGIAGPVGMLLSVPLASTFYILFNEETNKREQMQLAAQGTTAHTEQQELNSEISEPSVATSEELSETNTPKKKHKKTSRKEK